MATAVATSCTVVTVLYPKTRPVSIPRSHWQTALAQQNQHKLLCVDMLPSFPPARSLLSLIRRQGPIRLDQLYGRASDQLAPGTFRSKQHYKECLGLLKRTNKVWTFRESRTGRGSLARDVIAVDAKADNRRWKRTGRTLAKMNSVDRGTPEQISAIV